MKKALCLFLLALTLFAAGPLRRAPGFCLIDTAGQWQDLADYRGKVVLVEFMQTTCPHCAAFADVLNRVQAKYGDKIQILAIANPPDNPQTVAKFVQGHGVRYPVLFDSGQAAYSYMKKMKFELPQLFLVDQKGIIFNHYEFSALTKEIFEGNGLFGEIDRLLAPAPAKAPAKKK